MSLRFGYGTNGLAGHALGDAFAFLAEEGYAGVALALDHRVHPFAAGFPGRAARLLAALSAGGYGGLVAVELPRPSHRAHESVPRFLAFLRAAEEHSREHEDSAA